MQDSQSRFISVKQAASILGLAEITLRVWVARRRLAHVKLGRTIRIPLSEIDRLVDEGTVPAFKNGRR